MSLVIKLILESFRFAWNALRQNVLRTILSFLGVTIGIFAIIAVFTLVDSLEKSLKDSLNFLGTNNINVEKWPYGLGGPYPWWKYLRRPHPTYEEYEFLEKNVKNAKAICILAARGGVTAKHESNSSTDIDLIGITYTHKDVYELPIETGRYFSPQEIDAGRSVVLIGHRVANELFPNQSPIGRELKVRGLKYYVIGLLEEQGDGFLGMPSNDEQIYMPYRAFTKLYIQVGVAAELSLA